MLGMARKYRKFGPEFRDEAVKPVINGSRPIAQVAREWGSTRELAERVPA